MKELSFACFCFYIHPKILVPICRFGSMVFEKFYRYLILPFLVLVCFDLCFTLQTPNLRSYMISIERLKQFFVSVSTSSTPSAPSTYASAPRSASSLSSDSASSVPDTPPGDCEWAHDVFPFTSTSLAPLTSASSEEETSQFKNGLFCTKSFY